MPLPLCTSGVDQMSTHPPAVTPIPATSTAMIITCQDVDVAPGSSDPNPVPELGPVTVPVVESVPAVKLSSLPLSRQLSPVSSQTVAWGDAGDSSVPLSPNHVQAGHSQDVPDEGSLSYVSPVSPGFFFMRLCRCIRCRLDSLIGQISLRFRLCWLRGPPLVRRWGLLHSLSIGYGGRPIAGDGLAGLSVSVQVA